MGRTRQEENKALVLEAFNTLFNKRGYPTAERYWLPDYIQHSAHIEPRREGLFNLIKSLPSTLKYEPGLVIADGDFVIVHGRFSGFGAPMNWIAADTLVVKDGLLMEHWDVIQNEANEEQSKSGNPIVQRLISEIRKTATWFDPISLSVWRYDGEGFSPYPPSSQQDIVLERLLQANPFRWNQFLVSTPTLYAIDAE